MRTALYSRPTMSVHEKIHVVICDFNGWGQTSLCLEALRRSQYPDLEIVVVDHGTTTETAQGLAVRHPEVIHVPADPALWWTGATNFGIRTASARGARTIMLLNNDCYVTPDTLMRLAAHSPPRAPAIIAPLQRALNDRRLLTNLATTCFVLGFPTLPLPAPTLRSGEQRLVPTNLILGGRGVLVPMEVFDRVGLFDDVRLPHYGADHDFFLRCRRNGIALYLALDAFVDVDDTRTTVAANLGSMSMRQFAATLTDRRSHRNVRELSTLFRLHYPVQGLHHFGVALNIIRYALIYIARRIVFLARGAFSIDRP